LTAVRLLVAASVMAAGCAGPAAPAPGDGEGATCRSPDEPGLISCEEALQRAQEEGGPPGQYPPGGIVARLDWYRAHPKDPRVRVWAITYQHAVHPIHGPPGRPGPDCGVGDWDVTIDARTGEFLVEGGSALATPCPSP
jgi:hypothetical protein